MARKFLTPINPPALSSDPVSPTTGAVYFNTQINKLKVYNGTAWIDLSQSNDLSTLSIQQVNTNGSAVESYNNISTLQFDEDSGFDVTSPSAGVAKVAMNSTFKYWQVDGVQKLTATGLDTVNLISGNNISITGNGTSNPQSITIATSSDVTTNAGSQTLTNKTISGNSNIISIKSNTSSGWVSSDPVLAAGELGIETDTLKIKLGSGTTWTLNPNYVNVVPSDLNSTLSDYLLAADLGTASGPAQLDANQNLLIPNSSIIFEGATEDSYETTLFATDPTADRTITIPDVSGTIITTGDTGTVTNTMLAGSIENNKLSNSSITINGFTISLGGTAEYSTDNINQGTINKYFSDELAQDAIGNNVGNGLDYDDSTGSISVDPSEFTLNAVGSPTADVNMASYKITNLAAPTSSGDAANKAYVDNTTAGLNFHAAVHAATTTNLDATYNNGTSGFGATLTANSNGAIIIDGHTLLVNERVLVKNQTAGLQNGIYVVTNTGDESNPYILTRATDSDNSPSGEVAYGDFCFVQNGGQAGYGYILNTTGTINLGTTSISYVQFNAGQVVVAGNGLTETSPGTLAINTGVTVDLNSTQSLTNKTVTGIFIGNVTGDVSGNAGTVTNGVYTSGSYSDPVWITSLSKSKVGLGNVENTALSTWSGSSNITTLGTVTSGTWNGNTISIANGGTGQTTASDAINALLPSQSGNANKYLQTNGTTAQWNTVLDENLVIMGVY